MPSRSQQRARGLHDNVRPICSQCDTEGSLYRFLFSHYCHFFATTPPAAIGWLPFHFWCCQRFAASITPLLQATPRWGSDWFSYFTAIDWLYFFILRFRWLPQITDLSFIFQASGHAGYNISAGWHFSYFLWLISPPFIDRRILILVIDFRHIKASSIRGWRQAAARLIFLRPCKEQGFLHW